MNRLFWIIAVMAIVVVLTAVGFLVRELRKSW
jgi:hypothetical protein